MRKLQKRNEDIIKEKKALLKKHNFKEDTWGNMVKKCVDGRVRVVFLEKVARIEHEIKIGEEKRWQRVCSAPLLGAAKNLRETN